MFFPIPGPNGEEVYPIRNDGSEGRWRLGKREMFRMVQNKDVEFSRRPDGLFIVYEKIRSTDPRLKPFRTWMDDVGTTADGSKEIKAIFGSNNVYSFPKPTKLISFLIKVGSTNDDDFILDHFAGSGTTAHAVLNLNEEDDGARKYILIEMGDYFHTVMKPRIEKVSFASEWKNGKPVEGSTGKSHIFKYQSLEQYEDALDNIVFRERDGTVTRTLFGFSDYMLHYMLGFETQGSPCRLNTDALKKPFEYTLRIRRKRLDQDHLRCSAHDDGSNTWWDVKVDLVETFNYLLGLHVQRVSAYDSNDLHYLVVFGRTQDGGTVTVVWRNSRKARLLLRPMNGS